METILRDAILNRVIYTSVFLALLISPMSVSATTYVDVYQPQSTQEKIAYLYGVVAQLQTLLYAREDYVSYNNYNYTPNGRVLGVVYPGTNRTSDLDVSTLSARDIRDDEADLRGEVDLNYNRFALVWFEYGESRNDLDERTSKRRISDSYNKKVTFTSNVDDLDEDEKYYYRAVAEDNRGDREYGSVKSFTTDDNDRRYYSYNSRYSDSEVDVDTLSARDVRDDEADLRGRVDLNDNRSALVWFEYGESRNDLDERTSKKTVHGSRNSDISFSSNVRNLDEDEKYYYRAVAEGQDGDKEYGSILSFETDDNYYRNNRSSGDFELSVSDTRVNEGDKVSVYWEIPDDIVRVKYWIGMFHRGDDNDDDVAWRYLPFFDSGVVDFWIEDEGEYEFRIFQEYSTNDLATSERVLVD